MPVGWSICDICKHKDCEETHRYVSLKEPSNDAPALRMLTPQTGLRCTWPLYARPVGVTTLKGSVGTKSRAAHSDDVSVSKAIEVWRFKNVVSYLIQSVASPPSQMRR
jgi:hypothetical protein